MVSCLLLGKNCDCDFRLLGSLLFPNAQSLPYLLSLPSFLYLLPLLRPIMSPLILLSASTSSSNSREQGNRSQLTNSSMHNLQQGQRLRPLCKLPNTRENISRPVHSSNQQHSSQNSAPEDGRNGIVEDQVSGFERGGFAFGRRAGGLLGSVGHGWRCGIGVGVVFWRRERESNTFESLGASGDLDPGEGAPG